MDDPRGGAEYAKEFYESWEFAKRAVCLYAAGVSWRGASLIGVYAREESHLLGEISEDGLREALPRWFVDGRSTLYVALEPTPHLADEGAGTPIEILSPADVPPDYERGHTMLWPACGLHPALQDVIAVGPSTEAGRWLLDFSMSQVYQSLKLPPWALGQASAAAASVDDVTAGLYAYRQAVDLWRYDLSLSLGASLKDLLRAEDSSVIDMFFSWNGEWSPQDQYGGWEGVYEAFRDCGLPLTTFGREYPALLQQAVDASLLSADVLGEWKRLGLR